MKSEDLFCKLVGGGMIGSRDEEGIISKRVTTKRTVVGATNRKVLKELDVLPPYGHRRSDTQRIEAYQKKVIEAAKMKAAARKQRVQPSKSVEDDLVEPYVPNENRWMIMSYEVDIKADAVNRLNYIVRRLQAQAVRRGRELFRRTGTPRSEDDADSRKEGELPAIISTKPSAAAPSDLIVATSLTQNASIMPPSEAFITTWSATTSPKRIHDPSMIYKKRMLLLQQARSRRSYEFQQGLDKFAALQEKASIEKDRRLLQQKGALQRAYKETLERQMAMTKTSIRRGLGEYNTLALPQLKDKITSVWGTYQTSVIDELHQQGTDDQIRKLKK